MSDSTVATLVGIGVVIVMRLLDYYLPKGWHWKGIHKFAEPDHKGDSKDKDPSDSVPDEV